MVGVVVVVAAVGTGLEIGGTGLVQEGVPMQAEATRVQVGTVVETSLRVEGMDPAGAEAEALASKEALATKTLGSLEVTEAHRTTVIPPNAATTMAPIATRSAPGTSRFDSVFLLLLSSLPALLTILSSLKCK
ncbi:hypothetical protein B0J17DRAFT_646051 [Rhizoctonia solani]|nr:hypothetical protein B0J17DRAFT_646051 [Rhizoctonia solani]